MVNLSIITHEVEFQGVKFKGKNLAPKKKSSFDKIVPQNCLGQN